MKLKAFKIKTDKIFILALSKLLFNFSKNKSTVKKNKRFQKKALMAYNKPHEKSPQKKRKSFPSPSDFSLCFFVFLLLMFRSAEFRKYP